jgi:hypothetical protein
MHSPLLPVVVHHFHIPYVAFVPAEAHTILQVNADAVLAFSITFKPLEMMTRRISEILHTLGQIQRLKPPDPLSFNRTPSS